MGLNVNYYYRMTFGGCNDGRKGRRWRSVALCTYGVIYIRVESRDGISVLARPGT